MKADDVDSLPIVIRKEAGGDRAAVRAVNEAAFETSAEAELVEMLRREAKPVVSLVAERGDAVVGHIMFSPVRLSGRPQLNIMGLGPMAVSPACQRRGIGSALVWAGLDCCRRMEFGAIVVLGHPHYYPRFGFVPSVQFGFHCEYSVPEEAFMALELDPGYLSRAGGIIQYHAAFKSV